MENASRISLTRQMALSQQMNVIANNIANVDTPGFKADRMMFEEVLRDVGTPDRAAFVHDIGVVSDLRDGTMDPTGNPLDLAIQGQGYFEVETDQGVRYTRGGSFQFDADGAVIDGNGHPLLAEDGFPIFALPGDGEMKIDANGVVSSDSGEIGRLALVTFDDPQALLKVGQNLYSSDADPNPAVEATVLQGFVERSNVEPIVEMTRMITVLRSYQGAQALANKQDELRRRAINVLGNMSQQA